MKKRLGLILFIILDIAVIGIALYSLFTEYRVNRIKKEIEQEYGQQIISVEADKKKLEVVLDIKNENVLSIKKEIEEKYQDKVRFKLVYQWVRKDILVGEEYKEQRRRMFERYLYEGCDLVSACDFEEYRRPVQGINGEDLEKEVWDTIHRRVEMESKVIPIEKELVEENDLIKISYRIFSEKQVFFDCPQETVRCGQVLFDSQIENTVKGRKIGETYTIEYIRQNIGPQDTANCQCEIKILFAYVTEPAELNDEFAKENTMYSSVQEWHDTLLGDEYIWRRQQAWDEILTDLIDHSEFVMNEEVLADKAADLAFSTKFLSEQFGVPADDLLEQQYGTSDMDQYILRCYRYCEKEIKTYLLVKAIADYAGLTVSEDELRTGALKNGTTWNRLNEEEQTMLAYELLIDKVMNYMCKAEAFMTE